MTIDDAVLLDYALGSLPTDQVEEVELFLHAHPEAAGRVRRIQDELARLVLSLPGETVSKASEDALLHRLRRHREPPVESGSKRAAQDRPSYRWAAFGLAAALGLAAWLALGPFSSSGRVDRQIARYQAEPGALSTKLLTPDGADIGTLVRLSDNRLFVAFEQAPAPGVYQLWEIRDGSTESLAVVEGRTSLTGPVADGSVFAVTLEPAGSSSRPTSPPLVQVPL
jgi:anti-sigma-K factor RskA